MNIYLKFNEKCKKYFFFLKRVWNYVAFYVSNSLIIFDGERDDDSRRDLRFYRWFGCTEVEVP